ncbi:secreted RxLR effector protein 161-like [Henckelia pumila]|uniref:secreted RxLR effector protein 161-like n=1 Tax=Henckelia pumila TaxID=405737 RepID=UPI003C6E8C3C
MAESEAVSTPIGAHFKLMAVKEYQEELEEVHMENIPYSNAVGSIMYMMVSTRPDLDKRRSISGYVFTVGGNVVSWKSNLQNVVALYTTEAEYIILTEAVKEGLWVAGFVTEMGLD